jgi:hypothetical protein
MGCDFDAVMNDADLVVVGTDVDRFAHQAGRDRVETMWRAT